MGNKSAVTLDPNSPVFQTPDAAADAISQGFKGKNEQAAAIIKRPDGTYGYSTVTPPQTETNFALRLQLPQGHALAGIVHNHPGTDSAGQVFSPDDINVANQLKVPSFIRFNKDSSIRQYIPGVTATQRVVGGDKTALGDPIAATPAPGTTQALVGSLVNRDDPVTQEN